MKLQVSYFGMLAEITGTSGELLDVQDNDVNGLLKTVIAKYPELSRKQFTVAVDRSIAHKETSISEDSEIAFLPPFAGG